MTDVACILDKMLQIVGINVNYYFSKYPLMAIVTKFPLTTLKGTKNIVCLHNKVPMRNI